MLGKFLRLEIEGASHARAIRFTLEKFPTGFPIDEKALAEFMARRAPGRDKLSTQRREPDKVEFVSGVKGGITDGSTIRGLIRNLDARPDDYGAERTIPRPMHADLGQWIQFGRIPTGGGKNSGRMTAALCAAGGIAGQYLMSRGVSFSARLTRVGDETNFRKMLVRIEKARKAGESVGGEVSALIEGVPAGLGGPLFEGVETELSGALFGIPGVVSVRFEGRGILGGRTTGLPISFTVGFKATPTTMKPQRSIDLVTMKPALCVMKGRHDPCIAYRAVPVIEAVAAFVIADAILADEAAHPRICLTLTGKTLEEDLAQYRSQAYFTDMLELRLDLLKASERAKGKVEAFLRKIPKNIPVILTKDLNHMAFTDGRRINAIHDFQKPVPNLAKKLRDLGRDGAIAKIAFQPRSLADVSRLFSSPPPSTSSLVIAMGGMGFATRALAARLNAPWTYTSVGGVEGLGHVSPFELVRDYRFRSVSREATLFGVTGWPLAKTRSPELHNAAFLAEDEDAVMIPCPAKTAKEALAFMKAMKMKGLAVTIPHKETIMPLLDAIDPLAKKIGAVNTVSFENGKYVGYNTDITGFAEALTAFVGEVRGKRVAVLGDGGAAQAVKAALKKLGAKFTVFHRRTPPQGFDMLVNATPVDPIPEYVFTGKELVYDLRYVPEVTPLMERAAKAGCRVENGFSMLRAQAREQRRIWGV